MFHSREIVSLYFGQAGIQIGNAVWEMMIAEHGIKSNGFIVSSDELTSMDKNAINTFFHSAPTGQYIPRALIIDSEPTVIDEIRTGYYRRLFHPDFLISGVEDAANNFARGFYTIGQKMLHSILDKIRFMIESCDNFKGFLSFSGSGGGTGSGLYSLLLDRVMLEFTGKTMFATVILPGKTLNDSIVDPYNSIFRINQSLTSDVNLLIDNESMYKICFDKMNIHRPTYTNLNRLLAPILSSITAPFRFPGPLRTDLSEITTNLIPFKRINFPTLGYSPFTTQESFDHSSLFSKQLIKDVFLQDHNLLGLDLQKGRFMSSVLTFRGIHQMGDVIHQLNSMKSDNLFQWVDWCPSGFKISQSLYPGIHNFVGQPQNSVLMMCNHSEVVNSIGNLCKRFTVLFHKQCFIHWFVGEGMEIDEMADAINNVNFLKSDYDEICKGPEKEDITLKDDINTEPISDNVPRSKSELISKNSENLIISEKKNSDIFQRVKSDLNSETNPPATRKNKISKLIEKPEMKRSETLSKKNSTVTPEIVPTSVLEKQKSSAAISLDDSSSNVLKPKYKKKISEEYQMTAKAKEVLFNNITSLSPELKQRMFGYVE